MRRIIKNITRITKASLLSFPLAATSFAPVFAASLTSSSLELGDPQTGVVSTYKISASGLTGTIQCVEVDLGTASDGSGAIGGLSTASSTLDAFAFGGTGWVVSNAGSANQQLRATNASGQTAADGSVTFGTVTNGNTENVTYYGVLTTFSDASCTSAVDTSTVSFVYKNGEPVSLTIDPTLSFSCAAVTSATEIYPNGAASETTTVDSTATGIDHASTVNATTNGVSAHDLTVVTNGSGGYNVYVRHTQALTNQSSDTIDGGSLTNAAFTAAGTEGWAWSSDDDNIATPLNGSGSGLWNSFTTTNAVIMDEETLTPESNTERVSHQVGVSGTTPAGTYTTTILYTAVAVY